MNNKELQNFIAGIHFGDVVRNSVMDALIERGEQELASALEKTRFKLSLDARFEKEKWREGSFEYSYVTLSIHAENSVFAFLNKDIQELRSGQIHSASLLVLKGFNCRLGNPPRIVPSPRLIIDCYESPLNSNDHNISEFNGCHFRSKSELALAEVLDDRGISFISNGRGRFGKSGNRRTFEPDFLVFWEGQLIIIEVDGPKHDKKAQSCSDEREIFLYKTGINEQHIFRFSSVECYNDPEGVVSRLMNEMRRLTKS